MFRVASEQLCFLIQIPPSGEFIRSIDRMTRPGNAQILFVGHSLVCRLLAGSGNCFPTLHRLIAVNLRGGPQQSFARSSIRLHVHRMRSGMIA
jgi:hypothetical protein